MLSVHTWYTLHKCTDLIHYITMYTQHCNCMHVYMNMSKQLSFRRSCRCNNNYQYKGRSCECGLLRYKGTQIAFDHSSISEKNNGNIGGVCWCTPFLCSSFLLLKSAIDFSIHILSSLHYIESDKNRKESDNSIH